MNLHTLEKQCEEFTHDLGTKFFSDGNLGCPDTIHFSGNEKSIFSRTKTFVTIEV